MKILLYCHLGQIREYAEYVTALGKVETVQSRFLTMGQDEYALGRAVGAFDQVEDILPAEADIDDVPADELRDAAVALGDLEERIGHRFVNRDILVDRYFRAQPRLDVIPHTLPLIWTGARTRRFMYLVYRRLEQEIAEFRPDFLFVETSFAPARMAWRLAHERGIPAGAFMSVRFWPERLYLETGIGYEWQRARDAYADLEREPMTDEEAADVTQRLETVRQHRTKPAYLQSDHARGAPGFVKRLAPDKLLAGVAPWLGQRAKTCRRNPQVLPASVFSPLGKLRRYRNGRKATRFLARHQTPLAQIRQRKYAVYFLHVQPELTVEGMAFDFHDQVNTLTQILAALPADTELVVKEHSPMHGYRPLGFYDQLVHMPGVTIAETQADSHELIMHAEVIVTLTGTVALEAIVYGIPAIVLGSIYFDRFNGIYKAANLDELRELLSAPAKLSGATDADAIRTLCSMRRASGPGRPPRVDVALEEIDATSAQTMLTMLKRAGDGDPHGQ